MVSLGETTVLCTAVAAQTAKPGQDFFPLTVIIRKKHSPLAKSQVGFSSAKGARLKMKHWSVV